MDPTLRALLAAGYRPYANGGMATEPKVGDAYYGPGADDAADLARMTAQQSAGAIAPREVAAPAPEYPGERLQSEYADRLPMGVRVPRMATEIRHTDEGAQPYDVEGKPMAWGRNFGMLPVARDEGGYFPAQPVLPDILGNIMGAPVGGAMVAARVMRGAEEAGTVGAMGEKGARVASKAKAAEPMAEAAAAESKAPRPITAGDVDIDAEHALNIERQERRTINDRNVKLTDAERALVASAPAERQSAVAAEIRRVKARFPVSDGWAPIEASKFKFADDGTPKVEWQAQAYGFNRDGEGKTLRRGTPAYDKQVDRTANNSLKEIRAVIERARNGDPDAETILRQAGWYRETMRKGFDERGGSYPGFADILGGTSPNTSVDQNYRYSVDAQRRFARGDFDPQVQFAKDYEGSLNDFPPDQLIRRENAIDPKTGEAKQYGMNSRNAQMAMADRWREQVPGQAPKARNFSGNLGGQTDEATIDVWAARHLNRMLGNKRLPTVAESGVGGSLGKDLTAGGEFGFGQDVYRNLAGKLNKSGDLQPWLEKLGYNDVTPMDLQALTWFIEKEHWGKNNWTTKAGEGGSFEDEIRKFPTQRWQSGMSIQQDVPPSDAAMATARQAMENTLRGDNDVRVFRVHPTYGRYAGSNERSFDVELSAKPGWNPSNWMESVIQQAKEHNQHDVFFSRRIDPVEAASNPNARPGVEIYFSSRKAMDQILPALEEFTNKGQDGFTFTTDLKLRERTAGGSDVPDYVGVRLQWVPEISMRWDDATRAAWARDPAALAAARRDATDRMLDALNSLDAKKHGIVDARLHHYDTTVVGKEDYDAALQGIARRSAGRDEGGAGAFHPAEWQGQPLQSHVARRNRALGAGPEAGPLPDDGGAVERAGPVAKARGGSVFGSDAYRSFVAGRLKSGRSERTVPEPASTLHAQVKDLADGVRPVVLLPSSSKAGDHPPLPKGKAKAEIPGQGTAYYDPSRISEREVLDAARAGRLNDVLNMGPTSKADALARMATGDRPAAVVLRDKSGVPKVEQATTASMAGADAAAVKGKGRETDTVEVTSPERVIAERYARSSADRAMSLAKGQ